MPRMAIFAVVARSRSIEAQMDMNKPEGSEDKSEQEMQDYLNDVKDALRKCFRDPKFLWR
jgi:hypothetical protein